MPSGANRWMNLPLSLVGRISCIKINILFQMLPTAIPKYFFRQLHSAVSRFIWMGKTPRIRLKIPQGTPREGGLKFLTLKLKVPRDGITQVWFTKGIRTFGDLYKKWDPRVI